MTERNEETLTTRDLASGNDAPARTVTERDDTSAGDRSTGSEGGEYGDEAGTESVATPTSSDGEADSGSPTSEPLLPGDLTATFQRRWEEVQTRFVDEPRGAVEDADGLVANVMNHLAQGFAQERDGLEAQWGRGEDISTEDLRVALQRYRSFFQRLLST
jgi:hypothetical protein